MKTENIKTKESHIFVLNLSQRSGLRSSITCCSSTRVYLYTWKNITKRYKNNKLKIIAPTCNDEFELSDGFYFVSDIEKSTRY